MNHDRLLKLNSTDAAASLVWVDCQKVAYCVAHPMEDDHNCTLIHFDGGSSVLVRQSCSYVSEELHKRLCSD